MNNFAKVPFYQLALTIDEMYNEEIADTNIQAVEDHIQKIAETIRAAGYSEEEFFDRWLSTELN